MSVAIASGVSVPLENERENNVEGPQANPGSLGATTSCSQDSWFIWHSGYANTPFVIYSKPSPFSKTPVLTTKGNLLMNNCTRIAEVMHDEGPDHEIQKLRASAIAAAPKMLAALSWAAYILDGEYEPGSQRARCAAAIREAIAEALKAEGK